MMPMFLQRSNGTCLGTCSLPLSGALVLKLSNFVIESQKLGFSITQFSDYTITQC